MSNQDWFCKCGYKNHSYRDKCKQCEEFKLSKTGDWNCKCGYENYSHRDKCNKCGESKIIKASVSPTIKPGDWKCDCGFNNFASRNKCFKCNKIKSDKNEDEKKCIICFERDKSIVFKTCGHLISCNVCCYAMNECPMCREKYTKNDILIVYQ